MALHSLRNLRSDDLGELEDDPELLENLGAVPEVTDLGVRVHRIAELPEGQLIDDEESVRRLLGL